MRIDHGTAAHITTAVQALDTPERRARYLARDFPRADAVRDLDKRYRWDLYWAAPDARRAVEDTPNLLDAHIDTVLRRAIAPLAG